MSALWIQLHTRALNHKEDHDIVFLMQWIRSIPYYTSNCRCREFFTNWMKTNPIQYGPHLEYFKWTVKAHNAVNVKLSKPEMSVEDAVMLYQHVSLELF